MQIAVIGTGFIGGTLGRALAKAGHQVTFGSRREDDEVASETTATVAPIADALANAEVVILAVPGAAVAAVSEAHA
jgi:8-hydroxy-5-deazaflavin:NADPH oxidoreductase